jgi:hypothetical protein
MIKSILSKSNDKKAGYVSFSSLALNGSEFNMLEADKFAEKKIYFKRKFEKAKND